MNSQPQSPPHPSQAPATASAGSVAVRVWDVTKKLITITDHMKTLEKEDIRAQGQILELSRTVLDLVKEVRGISGQMKGIEKRIDDKDKMIDAIVKLRIMEEIGKVQLDTKQEIDNRA